MGEIKLLEKEIKKNFSEYEIEELTKNVLEIKDTFIINKEKKTR